MLAPVAYTATMYEISTAASHLPHELQKELSNQTSSSSCQNWDIYQDVEREGWGGKGGGGGETPPVCNFDLQT